MNYTLTVESFDSLTSCWNNPSHSLRWSSPFVLPPWMKVWWQTFGTDAELYLNSVRQGEEIIGIAPLQMREGKVFFIGSVDVCDYLDFIIVPGREEDFFNTLLADLEEKGINLLDLRTLRPDATVLTHLVTIAQNRGYEVLCQPEDVSAELDLPATWEEYLTGLNTKQRHEVRRKLRRLSEAGKVEYHFAQDSTAVHDAMDTFLKMFTESRQDKATFLTAQMESFLKSLTSSMTEAGLLRLGILELDRLPAAMIICFDYNDCLYLYNSGYDPRYNVLSAGLLCKVLSIKESIQEGKKRFDFLKGSEPYKYRLGGREIPLYRCRITIK